MANQPAQEISLGLIRASIWANHTDNGIRHNDIFTRLYKTVHGWQDTATFSRDDLPLVSQVAELARQWLLQDACLDQSGLPKARGSLTTQRE
jgi:hypothetical protein